MMNTNVATELNMNELAGAAGGGLITDFFGVLGAENFGRKLENYTYVPVKIGGEVIDYTVNKVKQAFEELPDDLEDIHEKKEEYYKTHPWERYSGR